MIPDFPFSWRQLLILNVVAEKLSRTFSRFVEQMLQTLEFRDDYGI